MGLLLALMDGAAGYCFLAAMLVLGLWHFALYLRAMRADSTDAAWQNAEECQTRAAEFSPEEAPMQAARRAQKDVPAGFDSRDVCVIVGVGLIAAIIRGVMAYWGLPLESRQSLPLLFMYMVVGPYVLVGSCYVLVRRLGGGQMVCTLCALIAALNITWSAMGVPFALLALVFVLRSMDDGRSRAANQAIAAVFAAFGMYLDASVALFAAGLWLIGLAGRLTAPTAAERKAGAADAAFQAVVFPLTLLAAYFLMQMPGAAVQGVTGAEFGQWLVLRLYDAFAGLIAPLSDWAFEFGCLVSTRAQWGILPDTMVCMLYGAVCTGLALWTFGKTRDRRALIATGAAVLSLLALLLGACWLVPAGSLLVAGYIWGRWDARGGRTQVLLGGGMLVALCVLMDLASLWSFH